MRNIVKRRIHLLSTFLLTIVALTVFLTVKADAAVNWPSLSASSYCEMKAPKNINVFKDSNLKTRGTSSPSKAYKAYISIYRKSYNPRCSEWSNLWKYGFWR